MFRNGHHNDGLYAIVEKKTTGWQPTCNCDAGEPVPATTLDPFCGSGTVGVASVKNGRSFIGIDLNEKYLDMARERINNAQPRML